MKNLLAVFVLMFIAVGLATAGGYNIGDRAEDFKLKNVDGKFVSLGDFDQAEGFIVVFTCNGCPYAKAYQDRIIELDKKYKPLGYPVIAINPNDTDIKPDDSLEAMKARAGEKGYTFPYLKDQDQEVYKKFGATRTPHVYVLNKSGGELIVSYIGAIDDNYQDASSVKQTYLASAVDALIDGKKPFPDVTKAIGCSIKAKK